MDQKIADPKCATIFARWKVPPGDPQTLRCINASNEPVGRNPGVVAARGESFTYL